MTNQAKAGGRTIKGSSASTTRIVPAGCRRGVRHRLDIGDECFLRLRVRRHNWTFTKKILVPPGKRQRAKCGHERNPVLKLDQSIG